MAGQATVRIRDKQWTCSVAITYVELTTGLRGVESLPSGTGMLFILPMRQTVQVDTTDMSFPIDVVFISNNTVVDMASNIQPGYLVTPSTLCDMFMEVNAGETEGIAVGDEVTTVITTQPGINLSQIALLIVPLSVLGFAFAMVGWMFKSLAEEEHRPALPERSETSYLPETKGKVVFIGSCKVSDGICVTHNHPVSKTAKCPESPLTNEEWSAVWELVETGLPKGMSNPWVNGWWPKSLEEAEEAVRHYADALWDAYMKFEHAQKKALDNYARSRDKAIHYYRQYVMREYERGQYVMRGGLERAMEKKEATVGKPAVIRIGERPHKESELEYLADSPEFLAQTIEDIGYRDKIDRTFREAIARAKGLR